MKAMILAAGRGTRLKPLTDTIPKALVKVNGVPLLEHVIRKLKQAGYDEIIINLHHFGEQIIDFVEQKKNFGIRIEISDERDKLLDTGGGLQKAAAFFEGCTSFLVHNVDILSDLDLHAFREHHEQSGDLATLAVRHRQSSRFLLFDPIMRMQGWFNSKTGETRPGPIKPAEYSALAFSGIHLLRTRIFDYMKQDGAYSLTDLYISLCHEQLISGYLHQDGWWSDVGKPEELMAAHAWLRSHPQIYTT